VGVVTATHRNAGLRRFDLAVGGAHHRIEIALPAADSREVSGRVGVLPPLAHLSHGRAL